LRSQTRRPAGKKYSARRRNEQGKTLNSLARLTSSEEWILKCDSESSTPT
jgi:hypothetical protein